MHRTAAEASAAPAASAATAAAAAAPMKRATAGSRMAWPASRERGSGLPSLRTPARKPHSGAEAEPGPNATAGVSSSSACARRPKKGVSWCGSAASISASMLYTCARKRRSRYSSAFCAARVAKWGHSRRQKAAMRWLMAALVSPSRVSRSSSLHASLNRSAPYAANRRSTAASSASPFTPSDSTAATDSASARASSTSSDGCRRDVLPRLASCLRSDVMGPAAIVSCLWCCY